MYVPLLLRNIIIFVSVRTLSASLRIMNPPLDWNPSRIYDRSRLKPSSDPDTSDLYNWSVYACAKFETSVYLCSYRVLQPVLEICCGDQKMSRRRVSQLNIVVLKWNVKKFDFDWKTCGSILNEVMMIFLCDGWWYVNIIYIKWSF